MHCYTCISDKNSKIRNIGYSLKRQKKNYGCNLKSL